MSINLGKLLEELTDAGIPFGGIDSTGIISYTDIATSQQKEADKIVMQDHIASQVTAGIIEGANLQELINELTGLGIAVDDISILGAITYEETPTSKQVLLAENTVGNHIAKVKSRGIVDTDAMEAQIANVDSIDIKGNIVYTHTATDEQKIEALAIVEAHDPYNYVELRTGPDGYASAGIQLGMKYDDEINGTTLWVDHIVAVKAKFPKIQIAE